MGEFKLSFKYYKTIFCSSIIGAQLGAIPRIDGEVAA